MTGLPLPRFATLKSKEVNVRAGPGKRYPIEWVFKRAQMPVQIVGEFEHWRKISDYQGAGGWVHRSMLSSLKSVIFIKEGFVLRDRPSFQSDPVAKIAPTVTGIIEECQGDWCLTSVGGTKGWVQKGYVWGAAD